MSENKFADLSGLRAVVTGASTGIGRAIARELAVGGADVVIHCRQAMDSSNDLADEIRSLGRSAEVLRADFSEESSLEAFAEQAWNSLGGCDVWVNNAGVDLLTGSESRDSYANKLARLLEVDVRSTILLSHDVGARMRRARQGVILNIGWDQADRGMEGESGELFAAAKNAIMGFTRSSAVSLAPHVRVNCIAPGWIRTAWGERASDKWQHRVRQETPLERWGTPEDVAKLARYLVSRDAAYVTGQVINANGGAVR